MRLACLQAAAAARIAGSLGIHFAAETGDVALARDYLITDASCSNKRGLKCGSLPSDPLLTLYFDTCALHALIFFSIRQSTPLHTSARNGAVAVSELLLSANADVNARDWRYRRRLCMCF